MSRGKRYNGERQLNMKKVVGVIVVFILIILFIVGIKKILKADKNALASKNIEMAYYPVFTNGNWGVINTKGETVLEPAYAEMIMIPNKSKPVFVCTYDVNYVDGSYKTKVVNEKNEELFTNYQNINTIQNHDENNNLWFEENCLKVQSEGKYGLINLDGSLILPCEYDSIAPIAGIRNSLIIKKEGKLGLANTNGKIVVPAEYAEVSALTNNYQNGYIVKNAENKFGIIGSDGSTVLECTYAGIKHATDNNMYVVNNGTWQVILKDGTAFLEGKVDNATEINGTNIVVNNGGKYGIYNIETDLKIPFEYEFLTHAFDDKYIAKKQGKYGVINLNNEVLVQFEYEGIKYNKQTDYLKARISDGNYAYISRNLEVKIKAGDETILNGGIKLVVNGEVKYYDFKLDERSNKDVYTANTLFIKKENGKYGFTDKNGKVVVECKYEDAREQNDYGFSAIKQNGKWGAIDQYGNVVIAPLYTLKDENEIDFIGKWHASADKNANYFTDVQ